MPRISLFGAAPDTSNMGVSALFASTLSGVRRYVKDPEFTVFDSGLGRRAGRFEFAEGDFYDCTLYGARSGARLYRKENVFTMSALAPLGGLGAMLSEPIRLIDASDAVFHVCGGDSFSDLYGSKVFNFITAPMKVARARGKPLFLLPQTYGPYRASDSARTAADVMASAEMAWARDEHSYAIVTDMLGAKFDPDRHRCGVDLAFALPSRKPRDFGDQILAEWFADGRAGGEIIGFNVNGLIYNDPVAQRDRYGFKADYGAVVHRFLEWLLTETESSIVLVPHVMARLGSKESDLGASQAVMEQLSPAHRDRVRISPITFDQCEAKWLISRTDWFCGTRMHSTIASLSTGVPTATVSYSDKARGVFASCGQEGHVYDPRALGTEEVLEGLKQSYNDRVDTRGALQSHLPPVLEMATDQIRLICERL